MKAMMAIDLLLILANAMICSGLCLLVHTCMKEGMILHPLRCYLDRYLSNPIGAMVRKPLYGCLTCMTSFWGLAFFFSIFLYPEPPSFVLAIKFLAVVGLINIIIDKIVEYLEAPFLIHSAHQAEQNHAGSEM